MTRLERRLLLGLAGLAAVAVLVATLIAERGVEERVRERTQQSLQERAALLAASLGDAPIRLASRESLQQLARRSGAASGSRITLLDAEGNVVADSGVPLAELPEVENHASRPEVAAALAGRPGLASRRSRTLHREFLYAAAPGPAGGAVRVALDGRRVAEGVEALRGSVRLAGLVAFVLALGAGAVLTRLAMRPLRELRDVVASLAGGDLEQRLAWRSNDELGEIASAIDRMAEELRRRLREVTREKEQLGAVLAGMVEGVLVVDRKDRVALANPRLRELFGVWGEVEGRPHWEVIRRPEVEQTLRRAADSSQPNVLELATGGNDPRMLQMHAVRFPASGPLRGIVAVFHDVTELRRLEGIRRDFVANVSHELRTPLTAIRGFAETLLESGVTEEQRRQYLDVILRHAGRLSSLIEDLLSLSRIESRKLPLEPSEIDVARLAETLLRDLSPQLDARSLRAELRSEGRSVALADRRALEQVLANLLDNACKYTEPGGLIELRVLERAGGVRVEVADDGIGIPAHDLPRIFERFYRVDTTRSRDLGGTGLGLSIVKHLVQLLGGEVFVESEPGKGTTFAFTLPSADSH